MNTLGLRANLPIFCTIAASLLAFHSSLCWSAEQSGTEPAKSDDAQALKTPDSPKPTGQTFSGNVSWYGIPFNGKKTASGEIFDMNKLSAAHLKLPFFTKVLVENPRNGKSCIVKINDRGPYVKTRVMDLSREGARRTDILPHGVGYAECMVLK